MPSADLNETISGQVKAQWQGLLRMMTAQGASRADVMDLTLATAGAMVTLTADALWGALPEGSKRRTAIPSMEVDLAAGFVAMEVDLAVLREDVRKANLQ